MATLNIKEQYNLDEFGVFIFHGEKKFKVYVGIYSENKTRVYFASKNKIYNVNSDIMTDITKQSYNGYEIKKLKDNEAYDGPVIKHLTFYVKTSPIGFNTIGEFDYIVKDNNKCCSLQMLLNNEVVLNKALNKYRKLLKQYGIKDTPFPDIDDYELEEN